MPSTSSTTSFPRDCQKEKMLWPERQPLGGSMRNWFVSVLVVFAGLSHAALSAQKRAPVIDMPMHAPHTPVDRRAGSPPGSPPPPSQLTMDEHAAEGVAFTTVLGRGI